MEEGRRALEYIEQQLREKWPDLYMRADPSTLTLEIYGAETKFAEQLAMARQLAAQTAIHVVPVGEVRCSKSVARVPPLAEEDGRGVWVRCDCAEPHTHDWGSYKPLNPRAY